MPERATRPTVSVYIVYLRPIIWGIAEELYRSDSVACLPDASTRCGPILRSGLLSQLPLISCFRLRVRTPAPTTRLASYAADFGNSVRHGELYWLGSRRPESPWSIIRNYALDVAVDGRTHRRGLLGKDFAQCGPFISQRIDGGFASYLYIRGPCLHRNTSVPDMVIVWLEMAECGGCAPPVDKATSPLLAGPVI